KKASVAPGLAVPLSQPNDNGKPEKPRPLRSYQWDDNNNKQVYRYRDTPILPEQLMLDKLYRRMVDPLRCWPALYRRLHSEVVPDVLLQSFTADLKRKRDERSGHSFLAEEKADAE